MNIEQAIILGAEKLKISKIISASLDAEILLSFVLGKPKEFIHTHPEYKISKTQDTRYKKYLLQRIKGEPIAYLTGHKEFYGLNFLVNKNVLIPRPETELLVEEVIKQLTKKQKIFIIDVGTGSGCIPIAVAKKIIFSSVIPAPDQSRGQAPAGIQKNIKIIGLDISSGALSVAKKNAKLNGVSKRIKFIKSDLLKRFNIYDPSTALRTGLRIKNKKNTNIILTANLPYLTEKIYRQNYKNLKYEPKAALIAGEDGLKYYRQLLWQIKFLITNHHLPITCFFEIDPLQAVSIKKLIKQHFPAAKILIKKDLAGHNRLIVIKLFQKHLTQFKERR